MIVPGPVEVALTALTSIVNVLVQMRVASSKAQFLIRELALSCEFFRENIEMFRDSVDVSKLNAIAERRFENFAASIQRADHLSAKIASKSDIRVFLKAWYKYAPDLDQAYTALRNNYHDGIVELLRDPLRFMIAAAPIATCCPFWNERRDLPIKSRRHHRFAGALPSVPEAVWCFVPGAPGKCGKRDISI